MIAYTIDVAHTSTLIDATIVTTDCPEIAEVARRCGADVPFLRPKHLASDDSPDIETAYDIDEPSDFKFAEFIVQDRLTRVTSEK